MNARGVVSRRRALRVGGLCFAVAAIALVPNLAVAADASGPTIRATIGSDGKVSSAKIFNADGSSSGFNDDLPLTVGINHTTSGAAQTYTYHVVNTVSKTQTVHYDDTAGKPQHTGVTLQLPLVATLSVDLPSTMKDVTAAGGNVSTASDGSKHVQWTMVLFTPLGAATQDVSFTATGSGAPVAELRAIIVDPSSTAGLSTASQDATAGYQQEDFWAGYANGASGGLKQIADGISQLHDGIVQGADGAAQLADGSVQAHSGSQDLTKGLKKIHGGLQQVADPATGLPTALGGIDQMIAGVGSSKDSATLVGGLGCVKTVLTDILEGTLPAPDGNGTVGKVNKCFVDKTLNPSGATPPLTKTTGINAIVLGALVTDAPGAPSALSQLIGGLSSSDPLTPGIAQGLQQLKTGLAAAVDGINKLTAGSGKAYRGSKKLTNGLGQIADGQQQVADGLPAAVDGTQQLLDGVNQANDSAVTPLATQLQQASQNNHKQLAVLQAATAMGSGAPGGAGASYVFTQRTQDVALVTNAQKAADSGSSHTGRNVGIGLGGAALLLVGLGGGFVAGRSRSRRTTMVG
jgi:X-X-X-Leu-X-X-Gly heptad repeat protein